MPPRRPRKQLNSTRLQNSLRANVLSLISNDLLVVGCRCTWRVNYDDVELATKQITSKRMQLDEALSAINGVQFFFSSITNICSNAKRSKSKREASEQIVYPAIAYFIVYRVTETCNEDALFAALHNQEVEPVIQPINTRTKNSTNAIMENAAKQLFNVVKDHNNPTVQEMVNASIAYCYAESARRSSDEEAEIQPPSQPRHFPTNPCRVVVINEHEFGEKMHRAIVTLRSDGLVVDMDFTTNATLQKPCLSSTGDITATIKKIEKVMKFCDHALYRSDIYAKPAEASMTYLKMMDVKTYLQKLLTNEPIRDKVIRHFQVLERILAHPACEIIRQITFDLDLIEVSDGSCFRISSRTFIACPIPESKRGTLSPRAFIPYDCSTPPEPKFFRDGILNSFQETAVRANFLNKLYQCLLASQMPHKVRKLVVAGPKDSGKTSWASIFHRIIPPGYIASITNESQFSAAMITDTTQLVFVDDWSQTTLQSDLAKTILQGGWMVTAVKHDVPRCFINNSPYYITTNQVPDFGDEDENVKRRIAVFTTTSLPETQPGVDRWIFDHAMDCVAWIADEINANHRLVDADELWYEQGNPRDLTFSNEHGEGLFNSHAMRNISNADLEEAVPTTGLMDVIHRSFEIESDHRRLSRKRRARHVPHSSDEESCVKESVTVDVSGSGGDENLSSEISPFSRNPLEPFLGETTREPDHAKTTPSDDGSPMAGEDRLSTTLIEPLVSDVIAGNTSDHNLCVAEESSEAKEEEADADCDDESFGPRILTPSCWVLNTRMYLAKVAELLEHNFQLKDVTPVHARSFIEQRRKALKKRDKKEKEFWTKADPKIDAWMLVIGERRDVFELDEFVKKYPDSHKSVEEVRRMASVRILPCSCPIYQALKKCEEHGESRVEEETDEAEGGLDREGQPRRPVLSSQTYWTKVKGWRPW